MSNARGEETPEDPGHVQSGKKRSRVATGCTAFQAVRDHKGSLPGLATRRISPLDPAGLRASRKGNRAARGSPYEPASPKLSFPYSDRHEEDKMDESYVA
jgi:hypothetical protein